MSRPWNNMKQYYPSTVIDGIYLNADKEEMYEYADNGDYGEAISCSSGYVLLGTLGDVEINMAVYFPKLTEVLAAIQVESFSGTNMDGYLYTGESCRLEPSCSENFFMNCGDSVRGTLQHYVGAPPSGLSMEEILAYYLGYLERWLDEKLLAINLIRRSEELKNPDNSESILLHGLYRNVREELKQQIDKPLTEGVE